jgi:mannose-6-phosphate isomerase-like protein (cupin superfamily)
MPPRPRPVSLDGTMAAKPRIRWHLTAAHTDGRLLRAELWVPAGTPARPLHSHPREEERLELLGGTMELDVGERRRLLGCGHGPVVIAPGTPHSWRNAGPEVLHLMFDLELIG